MDVFFSIRHRQKHAQLLHLLTHPERILCAMQRTAQHLLSCDCSQCLVSCLLNLPNMPLLQMSSCYFLQVKLNQLTIYPGLFYQSANSCEVCELHICWGTIVKWRLLSVEIELGQRKLQRKGVQD